MKLSLTSSLKLSLFSFLIFTNILFCTKKSFAQDCNNLKPVCGSGNIQFNPQGKGINDFGIAGNQAGCFSEGENNSAWYKIRIIKDGTFTLSITPQNSNDDYDFGIWGPNVTCTSLGTPIRCNTAAAVGNTGLVENAANTSQGPGNGSNKSSSMEVKAGEDYFILIDNASKQGASFDLSFGGTATLGEVIEADFLINPTLCGKMQLISRATSCNGQRLQHEWTITDKQGNKIATDSNENPLFDLNIPTTYIATLKVTSLSGIAKSEKSKEIVIKDVITATLKSEVNCNQILSTVSALSCYNKNYVYEWNITDSKNKNVFNQKGISASQTTYLNSGTYKLSVKVTNDLGTTVTKDETLVVDVPTLQISAPTKSCFEEGQKTELSAKIIAQKLPTKYEINWYHENGTNLGSGETIKVSSAGNYTATLSYESCKIGSNTVKVNEYCPPVVYVPTAFSPNGDGLNDNLTVWGKRFVNLTVEVYDQWGNVIFANKIASENEKVSWDGTAKSGTFVPSGTYVVQTYYFDSVTSHVHIEQVITTLIR